MRAPLHPRERAAALARVADAAQRRCDAAIRRAVAERDAAIAAAIRAANARPAKIAAREVGKPGIGKICRQPGVAYFLGILRAALKYPARAPKSLA